MGSETWYKDGLRFDCTRCGNCCTGGPGMVRVTDAEIVALANRLSVSEVEFREQYTRPFRKGITILQEKPNLDCIFYEREKGCTVYDDRPKPCRTWPFWDVNVRSSGTWQSAAQGCPGMNRGSLHDAGEIQRASHDDGTCASALRKPR